MWLMQNGMTNPNNAGAAAYSYMHIMGIVSVGLMWLRMASAAARMIEAGEGDGRFLEDKIMTARFYAERIMPDAGALRRKIEGGRSEARRGGKEWVRPCRSRWSPSHLKDKHLNIKLSYRHI